MIAKNPILPGFYPDPSICRVGEYFYLVNSTFAYFPGVPVFRSRNLAQWEQIGNVLERESQLYLKGCGHSAGIYAPTIRYYNGTYYMITTNVSGGGNFVVTAEKPEGPWSEPYFLGEKAQGIDPSLFFDDDGSCYYIGQRANSAGSRYFGDCEIWIQKLDLAAMQLEGEDHAVLYGFERNAVWPEGPHLYKKDGYYYILHAEGGTENNHCIAAARSRNVFGPYEYCPANPIFTHRHLGKDYPVTCVGHGDLVDDGKGNWYMVMLACRPEKGYTLMGRETFLARVVWEDGWPVVNPGRGILEDTVVIPGGAEESMDIYSKECRNPSVITFESEKLPSEFLTLRNLSQGMITSGFQGRLLHMKMNPVTLKEEAAPCCAVVRQKHRDFQLETRLSIHAETSSDCAGLCMLQSNLYHIRMECSPLKESNICIIQCRNGEDHILTECKIDCGDEFEIRMVVHGLTAGFYWKKSSSAVGEEWKPVAEQIDLRMLSTEIAGGFTGCTVGMYASSNGVKSEGYADFEKFVITVHSNNLVTRQQKLCNTSCKPSAQSIK